MDPECSLQDVVQCQLCGFSNPQLHCDHCHIYLCNVCVEKHLVDKSQNHKVVQTKRCQKHSSKNNEYYCEHCDILICLECASSKKHRGHVIVKLGQKLESQKKVLLRDLEELEKIIYPKYQDIALIIPIQKADLHKNSQKVKTAIDKQGEDLHKEIDKIIRNLKADLDEKDSNLKAVLIKREDEITHVITEIKQSIAELKKLLDSNDVSRVSAYKSRNDAFRRLPPELTVSLPSFTTQKINKEQQLFQLFGSLSSLSIKTEKYGSVIDVPRPESSATADRPRIGVPQIITDINTEHNDRNKLRSVSCLNDEEFWTCGDDNMLRLYNLQGDLLRKIQTKSCSMPRDIAVTRGKLVYTDPKERTVNMVNNTQIQTIFELNGWIPHSVCSTSNGDILVVMVSDDTQTKVMRLSSSTSQKQSIQFDDKDQPLYSSFGIKYISENRNQDICVSDKIARALVVVNKAGKFRFSYRGHPSSGEEFDPVGLTTDSHGQILIADIDNKIIHIIDEDGQFLCYIDNCHLDYPSDLSVDISNNLFVAEYHRGRVRKIQYYI